MKNTTKKTKTATTSVLTLRRQSLRALTTTELGQVVGGSQRCMVGPGPA